MKKISSLRVLWLLNHTTLRTFEMEQLQRLGISEIFLPKSFPHDEGNLSATVDYSLDSDLTLPKEELLILNKTCWYEDITEEAWSVANRYFDIVVIGFFPEQIKSAVKYFKGAIVLRAFGLSKNYTYSDLFHEYLGHDYVEKIKQCQSRFWFGAGYDHLANIEEGWLAKRYTYLPIGLKSIGLKNFWNGWDKRILFICPRINTSLYFKNVYLEFIHNFSEFNFTIGGAQPIPVNNPSVIGFVSDTQHRENMERHRVMFYHSTEPNHIHFHPFEAVRVGMPLVFMGGGLLDRMGGLKLWGRCKTIKEAKRKIRQLFNDKNKKLIEKIQIEQRVLLEFMNPDYCFPHFKQSFQKITSMLCHHPKDKGEEKGVKIAIIVPIPYRGGSLRGCISLANSLIRAKNYTNDKAEITLFYLDVKYKNCLFRELNSEVKVRNFNWKTLTKIEASSAMYYAGHKNWIAKHDEYWVPNDGINYLNDQTIWLIISDRLEKPLLPIRPFILKIYDYIQRYVPFLPQDYSLNLIKRAQEAHLIFTTTHFTAKDCNQYGGIDPTKILKMPMLVPNFNMKKNLSVLSLESNYFIWTTNLALHKAHYVAFEGLEVYYEEFDGQFKCFITGVDSNLLLEMYPHLKTIFQRSPKMKRKMKFLGELSDGNYKKTLSQAAFLLHNATIDNGTFSVIEAAQAGTPSLSSDYPPMREIDERFKLNLTWINKETKESYGYSLKNMELEYKKLKQYFEDKEDEQFKHSFDEELYYWKAIQQCL